MQEIVYQTEDYVLWSFCIDWIFLIPVYLTSARYLGDQRFSYNQYLTYKLRIGEEQAAASILDIIIEGAGQRISAPFYSQGNPRPGLEVQEYKFRLNEHSNYQWYPQLKAETFISILANITAIKIRATYNPDGKTFKTSYEPEHDKTSKMMCAQRRLRSAWASAQSNQSLRCALIG